MKNVLTDRSQSLFTAVGGWRTVAEAVVSRMLFLVVYIFGRRSAHKMTQDDALAHLAGLDLKKTDTSPEGV